jgi:hypothetical protein
MTKTRTTMLLVGGALVWAAGTHANPRMPDRLGDRPAAYGAGSAIAAGSGAVATILDGDAARIGFQALLTDGLGDPLPGVSVELSFSVYAVGGVAAIETLPPKTWPMNDGLVQAQLPFSPDSFDGTGRELGVTITGESEMSPRIPLTSVPYAYRVNRVASAELDDTIELGDADNSGTLSVHAGAAGDGRIVLHGPGQLIETRDNSGALTSVYGTDAFSGGAACLLGMPGETTGLLLDGHGTAEGGGHVVLYDTGNTDAVSLAAGTSTVRIGSPNPGAAAGNLHLYPTSGAPSRIHLDGANADMRLGLGREASGNLRLYSAGGGIETIHANGATGELALADGSQVNIRLDATGGGGGGAVAMWNGAGTQTVEIDADEGDDATMRLSDSAGTDAITLDAASAQILLGSPTGGAEGDVHVYSSAGTPSTIHLDGATGDLRLGWPGASTGNLTAYASAGGNPTVQVDGATGEISLGDRTREIIRLDATAGGGGGGISMWNSVGVNTVEIDADENEHAALRLSNAGGG